MPHRHSVAARVLLAPVRATSTLIALPPPPPRIHPSCLAVRTRRGAHSIRVEDVRARCCPVHKDVDLHSSSSAVFAFFCVGSRFFPRCHTPCTHRGQGGPTFVRAGRNRRCLQVGEILQEDTVCPGEQATRTSSSSIWPPVSAHSPCDLTSAWQGLHSVCGCIIAD